MVVKISNRLPRMNRQEQTLLIWILSAAGMLLLLLYSPWGSPDLYNNKVYFAENQGVNFSKVNIGRASFQINSLKAGLGAIKANVGSLNTIKNAPKDGDVNNGNAPEIKVDDNYSKRKNENKYSTVNYPSASKKTNRLLAYNTIPNSKKAKTESASQSGSSSSYGGSSSAGSLTSSGSMGSFKSSAQSVDTNMPVTSVSSLNVDLTMFNDSTSLLAMDSAQRSNSDPGGEPLGEPIPIPDGWIFLLTLALAYIIIKRRVIVCKTT